MKATEEIVRQLLLGHSVYIDNRKAGGTYAVIKRVLEEVGYEITIPQTSFRQLANYEAGLLTFDAAMAKVRERRRLVQKAYSDRKKRNEETVAQLRANRIAEREQLDRNGHTVEAMRRPTTLLGVPGMDRTLPLVTPPLLGQGVEVFAMILLDDGRLRMGLQNDAHRWVVDVVGEMEREDVSS